MPRFVHAVSAVATVAFLLASSAAAQDINAAPSDAALTLAQGFDPDPRVVQVEAGGALDASALSSACAGSIASAPNVRVDYTGSGAPLIVSAASSSDVSLFVVAPNGAWYCDDDGGEEGSNPALHFGRPEAGAYFIWVGAASAAQAELQISASASR